MTEYYADSRTKFKRSSTAVTNCPRSENPSASSARPGNQPQARPPFDRRPTRRPVASDPSCGDELHRPAHATSGSRRVWQQITLNLRRNRTLGIHDDPVSFELDESRSCEPMNA
jgi:hypothetical protein